MIRTLAAFAAGVWLGAKLFGGSGTNAPNWWHPAMVRLFAHDQTPVNVPDDIIAQAEPVARAFDIPIGWVIHARCKGAADLSAAAEQMRDKARSLGAPTADTAAQWRAQVLAAWQ